VLQCEAITDIDVTSAEMLERLDLELNEVGIHLAFVELRDRLHDLLSQYGLLGTLDRDHFYGTIDEALAAIEVEEARKAEDVDDEISPAQDDPR
jgi:MFS superfamily sulfate permease-like transporter